MRGNSRSILKNSHRLAQWLWTSVDAAYEFCDGGKHICSLDSVFWPSATKSERPYGVTRTCVRCQDPPTPRPPTPTPLHPGARPLRWRSVLVLNVLFCSTGVGVTLVLDRKFKPTIQKFASGGVSRSPAQSMFRWSHVRCWFFFWRFWTHLELTRVDFGPEWSCVQERFWWTIVNPATDVWNKIDFPSQLIATKREFTLSEKNVHCCTCATQAWNMHCKHYGTSCVQSADKKLPLFCELCTSTSHERFGGKTLRENTQLAICPPKCSFWSKLWKHWQRHCHARIDCPSSNFECHCQKDLFSRIHCAQQFNFSLHWVWDCLLTLVNLSTSLQPKHTENTTHWNTVIQADFRMRALMPTDECAKRKKEKKTLSFQKQTATPEVGQRLELYLEALNFSQTHQSQTAVGNMSSLLAENSHKAASKTTDASIALCYLLLPPTKFYQIFPGKKRRYSHVFNEVLFPSACNSVCLVLNISSKLRSDLPFFFFKSAQAKLTFCMFCIRDL